MAGKRVNLSELATTPPSPAGVPVLGDGDRTGGRMRTVPVASVAPNPINPREDTADLSDLESMRTLGQLQPCVVVTRAAFTAVNPGHDAAVGRAEYVVVAGTRRRLAAEKYGLATLDIVVRDVLAGDPETFFGASISENIDRQAFAPLEEARALERLVALSGSGVAAAELLSRSKGWVSQRLALLKLSPAMQDLLRAGELPVHVARRLAQLPADEQLAAWHDERPAEPSRTEPSTRAPRVSAPSQQVRFKVSASPADIAAKMVETLPREQVAAIAALLLAQVSEGPSGPERSG
jgi:ParB family transcriptional regulator, chromosome partitioning protein